MDIFLSPVLEPDWSHCQPRRWPLGWLGDVFWGCCGLCFPSRLHPPNIKSGFEPPKWWVQGGMQNPSKGAEFHCATAHSSPLEPGSLGAWEPGSLGAWELGTLGAWEPGSLGAWELGSLGAWEPGSLGAWEPGSLGAWELGSLGAWELGSLGAWELAGVQLGLQSDGFAYLEWRGAPPPYWSHFVGQPSQVVPCSGRFNPILPGVVGGWRMRGGLFQLGRLGARVRQ